MVIQRRENKLLLFIDAKIEVYPCFFGILDEKLTGYHIFDGSVKGL